MENKDKIKLFDDVISGGWTSTGDLKTASWEEIGFANYAKDLKSKVDPVTVPLPTPPASMPVPNMIQNMALVNGVYQSQPGWQSDIACLHYKYDPSLTTHGTSFYVRFKRKAKYPRTGNLKFFRVWTGQPGKYPDFYIGQPGGDAGDWIFLYTEFMDPVNGKTRLAFDPKLYPVGDGTVHDEIYEWTYPSKYGADDGKFKITVDDKIVLDCTTWQCEGTNFDGKSNTGIPNYICIQDDPSNWTLPSDSFTNIWDIKISISGSGTT